VGRPSAAQQVDRRGPVPGSVPQCGYVSHLSHEISQVGSGGRFIFIYFFLLPMIIIVLVYFLIHTLLNS
jgi:hypothetical protein